MGFFSNLFGRNKSSLNKTDNIIDTENVNSESLIKTVTLDTILNEKIEYLSEKRNVFFQDCLELEEEKIVELNTEWNNFLLDFFNAYNVYISFDDIIYVNEKIYSYSLKEIFEKVKIYLSEEIDVHIKVLSKKFNVLVYQNDYGDYQFDNWFKELNYFFNRYSIINSLEESQVNELYNIANEKVFKYLENESLPDKLIFDENMLPTDYEYFCADILQSRGFDARVTKASGDQGADVIIYDEDNLPIIVIQCKMYSSPVGNKAVQEIYTAKQYYGANNAIVVTNNTFTKSAKQLAKSTKVDLLHHEDLYYLSERLNISYTKNQGDNYLSEEFVESFKSILQDLVQANYFILVKYYRESNEMILNNYFNKFFISIFDSKLDINKVNEIVKYSKEYKNLELFFKVQIFYKLIIIVFAQELKDFYNKFDEKNINNEIHKVIKNNILKDFKNANLIDDIDDKIDNSLNTLLFNEDNILIAIVHYIHFKIYIKNIELFKNIENSNIEWKNILLSQSKEILEKEFSYLNFTINDDTLITNFSQWHNILTTTNENLSKLIITEGDLDSRR